MRWSAPDDPAGPPPPKRRSPSSPNARTAANKYVIDTRRQRINMPRSSTTRCGSSRDCPTQTKTDGRSLPAHISALRSTTARDDRDAKQTNYYADAGGVWSRDMLDHLFLRDPDVIVGDSHAGTSRLEDAGGDWTLASADHRASQLGGPLPRSCVIGDFPISSRSQRTADSCKRPRQGLCSTRRRCSYLLRCRRSRRPRHLVAG